MTQATHTPGPWKNLPNSNLIVSADEKFSVAMVQPLIGCNGGEDGASTAEANRSLIVVAPELLVALEECADWFVSGGKVPDALNLRALVAKAKGGAA